MPVPNSGSNWRRIFIALLIGVLASYVWYMRREYPHGGSTFGVAYGTLAMLLIWLLAFFGIRKRWYRSRFGTLEQWLQSHIYLGILVLVVALAHTGGRFHDRVAVITFVLLSLVVLSGVAGAILYVTIPRLLTGAERNIDLSPDEISNEVNQLAASMARLASGRSDPFQNIFEELIHESRPGAIAGWRLLILGRRGSDAAGEWHQELRRVPRDEQEPLRQMLVLSRQRKELLLRLVRQQRYKNILESWLYVHVPVTIALLVFAIVHVVAVFYYGKVW